MVTAEQAFAQALRDHADAVKRYDRASDALRGQTAILSIARDALIDELAAELRARFDAELRPHLPEGCELEVFESCNGEPYWLLPVAAQVDHPHDRAVDGYGLCDAGADEVGAQVDYLLEQLREGLARYLPKP